MAYGPGAIEAARRRQEEAARVRGTSVEMADGARTLQVDTVLFHNARIRNQKDYGVENIWKEKEFRDDMARKHPEIAVKVESRRPTFGFVAASGPGGARTHTDPHGRRNRFGRVSFHKVYE